MKHFKVINQLVLKDGILLCKKPSGRTMQKAHFKQGDLDGACGAYSIAMVLNILRVFEADELYSDTTYDRRTAEWKLIKALNEEGLYRDGLDSEQIQHIITSNYSKYVNVQCVTKENDLIKLTQSWIDNENPIILRVDYDAHHAHWIVAVGYVTEDNGNPTSILTLDPGSNSPHYCLWNGIIDLPKVPKKKYGYSYSSDVQSMVDITEMIIITKK